MKQNKIINAYQITEILADNTNIPDGTQWDIYQLRKQLHPHVEFYEERNQKIKNKYLPFADENGNLNGDKATEYQNEINELNEMDKDIGDISKITIRLTNGTGLTARMMEMLEDFVDFVK